VVGRCVGARGIGIRGVGTCGVIAHSIGTRSDGARSVGARGVGARSVGIRGVGTRFLPGVFFGWWRAAEFQPGHSASAVWEKPDSLSAGGQARDTTHREDCGSTGCRGLALTFRMYLNDSTA